MLFTSTQLTRCQQGDAPSQRELYDLYKTKVMGISRRYTASREEAQDVLQETFIRVFQSINQVKDAAHLDSWIYKISVNTAINYYHKNKRHEHADEKNGYQYQDEKYELILSHFTDEMLVSLINQLPDGFRMVFNLYVVEGYSHAEIAKLLRISEVTSRSQLNRAKEALRNKLKSLGVLKFEKYA